MEFLIPSFLLVIAVIYLLVRWFTARPTTTLLDRGGIEKEGILVPDFERGDLVEFFEECRKASISSDLAKDFVSAMYNTMHFNKEPPAPKLSDDRYEVWGLDDDISEPLNYVLTRYGFSRVRWNERETLALQTIGDMLVFLSSRIEGLSGKHANNALKGDLGDATRPSAP